MFNFRNLLATSSLAVIAATSAQASTAVDVELSLLIDTSGSVDGVEFDLQRQGYVDAFRNSDVVNAILSTAGGRLGRIAVSVVYWSNYSTQDTVVDWVLLDSAAAISAFATSIENAARTSFGGTGLGAALAYGADSINRNAFDGAAKVIDVSGDGDSNEGISAAEGRAYALSQGIDRINGISIGNDYFGGGYGSLKDYYGGEVVGGTNSFVMGASGFDTFGQAIKTKLQAEITGPAPVPLPATGLLMLAGLGGLGALRRRAVRAA